MFFLKYYSFLKELYFIITSFIGSVTISLKVIHNTSFDKLLFHPLAGKIIDGKQYLFDGSPTIYPHGSDKVHNLYRLTRGAPEPEEIFYFLKIIKNIKANGTMIEVGAGHGFYSIIAAKYLLQGKQILIEASPRAINILKQNIQLNEFNKRAIIIQKAVTNKDNNKINFKEQGYASSIDTSGEYSVSTITVDRLIKDLKLKVVDLLHMDIQGEELNALRGMQNALSHKLVHYIFIGTHSIAIHNKCEDYLKEKNYSILFSQDLTKNSSYDGILIARAETRR